MGLGDMNCVVCDNGTGFVKVRRAALTDGSLHHHQPRRRRLFELAERSVRTASACPDRRRSLGMVDHGRPAGQPARSGVARRGAKFGRRHCPHSHAHFFGRAIISSSSVSAHSAKRAPLRTTRRSLTARLSPPRSTPIHPAPHDSRPRAHALGGTLQVGYAGENFPRSIFPSMVGRPILRAEEAVAEGVVLKEVMVGDEAADPKVRHSLDCAYPVEEGRVKNWDDMMHLWNYTFYDKLAINPGDHKILLTEPPMNPVKERQQLVTTMFETYGFDQVNISIQAMLTLYAQGLFTGVVVDTGDGVTHTVPVYDGFVPQNLIKRLNVAGRHITTYMIKLLLLRGYAFNRTADFETIRQIKEKFCYVAYDIDTERYVRATAPSSTIQHHPAPSSTIQHHLTLPSTTQHYPTLSNSEEPPPPTTTHHHPPPPTTHHYPPPPTTTTQAAGPRDHGA